MIRKFKITGYEPIVEKIFSLKYNEDLGEITVYRPMIQLVSLNFEFNRLNAEKQIVTQTRAIRIAFENAGWTDIVISDVSD